MYRALYAFKKTHPTSLSFNENDLFVELPGASADKNWHYVVNASGQSGYVPRNYVAKDDLKPDDFHRQIDAVKERVKVGKMPDRERGELLAKIEMTRQNQQQVWHKEQLQLEKNHMPRAASPKVSGSSSRSSTPPKSSKKRAAPMPPPNSVRSASNSPRASQDDLDSIQLADQQNSSNNTTTRKASLPRQQSQRRPSVTDPTEEQIKNHARQLVETVRNHTGLSYNVSQATVYTVLEYVQGNFGRLDKNVPALMCELEMPSGGCLLNEPDAVAASADTKALESLFEELTRCKEDDQQRNWMLYEDESRITQLLSHVCDRLQNAPRNASLHVLRRFKYFYVHNLVEYFQMEARWGLRRLLIEAFLLMCSLDPAAISLMLSSVLPLELAQDVFQAKEVERLRHNGLLLTVIFSRGEPMPVHYFEQLGRNFVDFLLDFIEEPPSREHEMEVVDVFMGLLLSYNLQFNEISSNMMINTLARRSSAKTFMEKVLLLLNRDEDPSAIVEGEYQDPETSIHRRPGDVHATHKIILDIFMHRDCHQLFYTNDLYVLIDIIVRQLSDLSSEDAGRALYVRMCELVLKHSDYSEHLHRFKDLERCFMRILEEEEETSDKKKITTLCHDIGAFSSLVQ